MGVLQLAALLVSLLVAVDANIRSEEEPFLPAGKHGLLFGEINLAIASVKILFLKCWQEIATEELQYNISYYDRAASSCRTEYSWIGGIEVPCGVYAKHPKK